MMSITKSVAGFFDQIAKARVLSTLLGMDREWLDKKGYSYQAMQQGVSAWPWRKNPEQRAREIEIKRWVRELNSFSDRQLLDLGISRSTIENSVRYGRDGFEIDGHHQNAA